MGQTDKINRLKTLNSENNLISDFGKVTKVNDDNTVDIELSNRIGDYSEVMILGSLKPQKGDIGVVIYAGRYKYPFFIPKYKGSISGAGNNFNVPIFSNKGDFPIGDFVNLRDEMDKRPELKDIIGLRAGSPFEEQWGTEDTIVSLINIAQNYYNNLGNESNRFIIGDISIRNGGRYGSHKGEGHSTGRACDVYTELEEHNVYKIKEYGIQRAFDILDSFYQLGVKYIIWDVAVVGLASQFASRYGNNRFNPNVGGHTTHWHISFLEGRG